jgi:hypothetical protein
LWYIFNVKFLQKSTGGTTTKELNPLCDTFRVSLYANDAALFLNPCESELIIMDHILQLFAEASGLFTNMENTKFYPTQCQDIDLEFLSKARQPISTFPCTYPGLPLNTRKPSRAALQPMMQKVGDRGYQDGRGISLPIQVENYLSRLFFQPCLLTS